MTDGDASAQFFAIVLTATWCGFGLYGILRKVERSPQARELLDRFTRAHVFTKVAVVAGLVAVVAIGGTKPGGGDPPRGVPPPATAVVEPAVAPVEVRTNNVALRAESSSAVEVEDWRRHGSSSGGVWLENGCCIAATPVGIAAGKNEMARHHSSIRHHLEETSLHA